MLLINRIITVWIPGMEHEKFEHVTRSEISQGGVLHIWRLVDNREKYVFFSPSGYICATDEEREEA